MYIQNNRMGDAPAAKWRGVDFRPPVSREFTVPWLTSFLTISILPSLHASNKSGLSTIASGPGLSILSDYAPTNKKRNYN